MGLKKYGKGDWRNISRNFVTTRTPTQVASHAQKYFIRQLSGGKDKRRSSIHDITTVDLADSKSPSFDNNGPPTPDHSSMATEPNQPSNVNSMARVPFNWNTQNQGPAMAFNIPNSSLFLSAPHGSSYGLKLQDQNLYGPYKTVFQMHSAQYQF